MMAVSADLLAVVVVAAVAGGAVALGSAYLALRLSTRHPHSTAARPPTLLDTSAIVDGRIADVAEAGFVDGSLVVPGFVVRELQRLADGPDPLRRNRGKRGFEVLERLRRTPGVAVEIDDTDVPELRDVDDKLVRRARALRAGVLTNDYNLNRVAGLQGVRVLNVNELANALRPVVLPGEPLSVQVAREGKEPGQGVGFLDDGTMVVVEHGKRFVGQAVAVVVTSVLQTAAGRMVFTRLREEAAGGRDA